MEGNDNTQALFLYLIINILYRCVFCDNGSSNKNVLIDHSILLATCRPPIAHLHTKTRTLHEHSKHTRGNPNKICIHRNTHALPYVQPRREIYVCRLAENILRATQAVCVDVTRPCTLTAFSVLCVHDAFSVHFESMYN